MSPRSPRPRSAPPAARPALTVACAACAALLALATAGASPAQAQRTGWAKRLHEIAKKQAAEKVERRVAEEAARGADAAMDRSVAAAKCAANAGTCRPAAAAPRDSARRDSTAGRGAPRDGNAARR